MKRIFLHYVITALAAAVLLTACGKQTADTPPAAEPEKARPAAVGQQRGTKPTETPPPESTLAAVKEPPMSTANPATQPQPIVVEVHHDTVCPWCRIGASNLQVALKDWDGPPVQIRYRPFLLNPNAPQEGLDLRTHLGEKYGHARVAAMFTRVTEVGRQAGLTFRFDKIRRAPDSSLSHVLIERVAQERQHDVVVAIQKAYFEDGADIGDVEVLAKIAENAGVSGEQARAWLVANGARSQLKAQVAAGRSGITGVPHFVINGRQRLQGAVPPARIKAALRAAM